MNIIIDMQLATDKTEDIPSLKQISDWVGKTLQLQNKAAIDETAEITLRIIDDEEMQNINREFRQKDQSTNILSFPFEPPVGIDFSAHGEDNSIEALLGDLVISAPRLVKEATEQNKNPMDHWAHLITHGSLHLLGYDHIEGHEAEQMEALEIQILNELGINNPFLIPDKTNQK